MAARLGEVVMSGLSFGESPRWHAGALYVSDWGAGEVRRLAGDGEVDVVARCDSFPLCIDLDADGRLFVVSSATGQLLRQERDGSLVVHAELTEAGRPPWNEVLVAPDGTAWVDAIGFDLGAEDPRPGFVAAVSSDGRVTRVADDLLFPNGMALLDEGATLVVAESYGHRVTAFDVGPAGSLLRRRVWADLGEGTPDGVCADADGALWYADVPARRCVRVREGGEVLDVVELDRGCFSCVLGGPDGRTLFVVTQDWGEPSSGEGGAVVAVRVDVPGPGAPDRDQLVSRRSGRSTARRRPR